MTYILNGHICIVMSIMWKYLFFVFVFFWTYCTEKEMEKPSLSTIFENCNFGTPNQTPECKSMFKISEQCLPSMTFLALCFKHKMRWKDLGCAVICEDVLSFIVCGKNRYYFILFLVHFTHFIIKMFSCLWWIFTFSHFSPFS